MAGEETQKFIADGRSKGMSDMDIFLKMIDTPKFMAGIKRGNDQGLTNRQIAAGLGLNVPAPGQSSVEDAVRKEKLRQGKEDGKTKLWESALLGFSDLGAGLVQGGTYVEDGINGKINQLFGTNFDTKSYERFTQERKDIEESHQYRREANDQGFDWGRLGGAVASMPLPAFRGLQGAKVLSTAGAKFAGQNAAIGATVGAASFAKDKETRAMNTAFGAAGGAVGGVAGEKIGQGLAKAVTGVKNQASRFSTEQTNSILQSIDQKLEQVLKQNGMNVSDLSADIMNGLRADALKALRAGREVDPMVVARKAVLEQLGLKGTQAQLSRDPKAWGKEIELSKIHNAGDPLRDKYISDNVQLGKILDDVSEQTGGTAVDQYGAMQKAINALDDQMAQNKDYRSALYDAAHKADGNDILLDAQGFANDAITALERQYAASSLPASIQKVIKDINNHPGQFTLGKSEEFIKILNREYKSSLQNGQPSSATYAIGLVRDALNNRQSQAMQGVIGTGNDAVQLYQMARQAHKFNAQQIESMPLLQDIVKGVELDKLFTKHILSGNVNELDKTVQLLKNVEPQSVKDIQQQVVEHIISKSINSNGQFSPAGMKKVLDSLGDRRLLTMFSPKELGKLRNISKAAEYLISHPPHSNVNHSNTGSTLLNHFAGILKLPGARIALSAVKDIPDSMAVTKAMNPSIAGEKLPIDPSYQKMIDLLSKTGTVAGAQASQQ